jgi:hypothetical protein
MFEKSDDFGKKNKTERRKKTLYTKMIKIECTVSSNSPRTFHVERN